MESEETQTLLRCRIHVTYDGEINANYLWSGNDIDGSERFADEDYMDWDDNEVIDYVLDMIGSENKEADRNKVTLTRD